jgi:4-hydroxy-tetrahydrodipicolinate reductase
MKNLRIGLIGYGKMGQMIESLAPKRGAEVVWKVNSANRESLTPALLRTADVVIEMTRPEAALRNVLFCLENGVPVVTGTTGWQSALEQAEAYCRSVGGSMLYASNFSIGVNLFFAFNKYVAERMSSLDMYRPEVHEWHHIHKKDAPSGTAVTIAEGVISVHQDFDQWHLQNSDAEKPKPNSLPIMAYREGEIVGTHVVRWKSAIDELSIEHIAYNREGFALGALLAAQFIHDKVGVFGMEDALF